MGLLPDTQNCGLRMRRVCRERFPRHRGWAIPICMPGSQTSGFLEVGLGENVRGIPGACVTRNFAYLVGDIVGTQIAANDIVVSSFRSNTKFGKVEKY